MTYRRDAGVAIPMVLGTMVVLAGMLIVALFMVKRTEPMTRGTQDDKAAAAAAQAGIEEFVSRLETTKGEYLKVAATDTANPARDTDQSTPQCDGPGKPLTLESGLVASYCYRLVAPSAPGAPTTLEVTGIAGPEASRGVTRTYVASLNDSGIASFLNYAYVVDSGVADPAGWAMGEDRAEECSTYAWDSPRPGSCANPVVGFAERMTITGSVHSNDTMHINDARTFTGPKTTTAAPEDGGTSKNWDGTGTVAGFGPVTSPLIALPNHNADLKKYVLPKTDTSTNMDRPGCLYRGITRLSFSGSQVSVASPNTNPASLPGACPVPGSGGTLGPSGAIPPVLYIDAATNTSCMASTLPGVTVAGDINSGIGAIDTDGCRGTAFVSGSVSGHSVTVGTAHDIIIAGDLTVVDKAAPDLIGLVAQGGITVQRAVTSSGSLIGSWGSHRRIDAAMVSLGKAFAVQNFGAGAVRNLTIHGSVTTRYAARVGTASTGYATHITYDERLRTTSPPFFLQPPTVGFRVVNIGVRE